MRKWIAALSLLMFIATLAGCGGSKPAPNTGGSTAPSTGQKTEPPKQSVTIEFWMPGQEPPVKETMTAQLAKFTEKFPHIKVNYTQIPWNEYFSKLNASFAGGLAPDVLGLGAAQFTQLVTQDRFLELDRKALGAEDVMDAIIQSGSLNNKLYGLLLPEVRVLVYRKDFFKDAGLDPEKPPKTLDELYDFARRLTKREGDKITLQGIDIPTSNGEQAFISMMLMKHGTHIWKPGGDPIFDGKEGVDTLQYLVNMMQKDKLFVQSDQQAVAGTMFAQGRAAMGFPQTQSLPPIEKAYPGVLGYAVPPKGAAKTALSLGQYLAVNKNSKQKEAAVELIKFLYSSDSQWAIYKGMGYPPTRTGLREKFLADKPENKTFFESLTESVGYPPNPRALDDVVLVRKALENAYYGKMTPEAALKEAAETIRKKISK